MRPTTPITILEKDNNRRGDLFGRLMADLFVALGYEQPHLNVHKSGRELDLDANHRLEPKRAIGECKATSDLIGGDDLNKFVGALDAENSDDKIPVTGYFISLAGFKETAIEQEKQRRLTKIVLLDGPKVIEELVRGRILVSTDRATEVAGRCCAGLSHLVLDPDCQLLAHERGWIWVVYYTQGKARTDFVLVHSDGTPLSRPLAEDIVNADRTCGGSLHSLSCRNPAPLAGSDDDPQVKEALAAYQRYLANECGYIQLDGLPADSDVGSRRLRLEHLFVPLHLDLTPPGREEKETRRAVGDVLSKHPRLALLAAPGGGKSTLLKRLAVAYSDPERRGQIGDDLPARDWLPLFFRCRELRNLSRGSFVDLLEALSEREPVRQHAEAFRAYVDRALLAGRVLLLVDGLDEISDSGDRAAFVCTLRAALQAYPDIAMVVTSRESGFRHVAAHLAPICTYATVSEFDNDNICRLTVAWHREVVGDTEKIRNDANQLAVAITTNDRIRRLASNPLLLTTLLLVKRWVGSLPTRRAVLYGKAVELLLMTWNTEGHDPIPEEEALPQLCWVASAMMLEGVQKVSRPRLAKLLQEARDALPTELGYVRNTVDEFIQRVEDRSSLLMMTGHDVEDGRLVEFFEFRHLTFQEFLTARGMVEGWHPGRREGDTLASVLEPHFEEEKWQEVIPLAAVLGGKATELLIQRLTEEVVRVGVDASTLDPTPSVIALTDCLADEAAVRPETISAALGALVRTREGVERVRSFATLARGRYGADLRNVARRKVAGSPDRGLLSALLFTVWYQTAVNEDQLEFPQLISTFEGMIGSSDRVARIEGALGLTRLSFHLWGTQLGQARGAREFAEPLNHAAVASVPMVFSENPWEYTAACWALAWLGPCQVWVPPAQPDVLSRLYTLWRKTDHVDVRHFSSWALARQVLAPREEPGRCASIPQADIVELLKSGKELSENERHAALVVAWYRRAVSDAELLGRARELLEVQDQKPKAPRARQPALEQLVASLSAAAPGERTSRKPKT